MRFLRGASTRALATAAAVLAADDDNTDTQKGGGDNEVKETPKPADGQQIQGDPGDENDDAAADGSGDGDKSEPAKDDQGNGDGSSVKPDEAAAAAAAANTAAAGRAEMCGRIEAVFASEHVTGREAAAATLLAADLPADKIIASLAKLPKGEASTNNMLQSIRGSAQNPELNNGVETDRSSAQAGADVWNKTHERLGFSKKQ